MAYTFIIPKKGKDVGKVFVEGNVANGNCIEKVQEQALFIGKQISAEYKDPDDNVPLMHDVQVTN